MQFSNWPKPFKAINSRIQKVLGTATYSFYENMRISGTKEWVETDEFQTFRLILLGIVRYGQQGAGKMKILNLVSKGFAHGGAEQIIREINSSLAAKGYDIKTL